MKAKAFSVKTNREVTRQHFFEQDFNPAFLPHELPFESLIFAVQILLND
jgi:hypothetical protein